MARICRLAIVSAGLVALGAPAALSQPKQQQLGKVHFETSCNAKAQKLFDHGMLYQHSFWYRASRRTFEEALKADPKCGIAYWGIALGALGKSPRAPAGKEPRRGLGRDRSRQEPRREDPARARLHRRARRASMPITTKSITARACRPILKAMEELVQRYPKDDEAQIAYAITLNVAASPADKTYANQLKGAALLEPIFKRQPQHPGVAHYLIHLYDYPPIAEKGLEAARRYAKIAPAAPHAQHMPSHIFTRVGYWKESIASNADVGACRQGGQRAARPAARDGLSGLCASAAGAGQEGAAVIDEMNKVSGFTETFIAGPYALAASPARYAVERGDWKSGGGALGAAEPVCLRSRR